MYMYNQSDGTCHLISEKVADVLHVTCLYIQVDTDT